MFTDKTAYICKNGGVWVLGHGDNSSNGEQGRSSLTLEK